MYQGCVVLVLLTDCAPGQGGTCFVTGSHRRVCEYLRSRAEGVPHQELNSWCIKQVVQAMSAGELPYHRDDVKVSQEKKETEREKPRKKEGKDGSCGWGGIEQVVGKAGDLVLVHPWCVHSGTTNLGRQPRLMLNGMVRVKKSGGAGGAPGGGGGGGIGSVSDGSSAGGVAPAASSMLLQETLDSLESSRSR